MSLQSKGLSRVFSNTTVIRELQIRTTMRYHFTTSRMAIFKKNVHNKCGKDVQQREPLDTVQFSSVQSLSRVRLFATPRIAACQASLSITKNWSSLRLTSIESVMPASHLILCRPLLLLPPIPPSIRVFSNQSTPVPSLHGK